MSELEYMDLAFEEILWTLNRNKSIIRSQEKYIDEFCNIILSASNKRISNNQNHKIFIASSGISNLVATYFARGLVNLGFNVFVFGESNVPHVSDEDIIIILSKSENANSILRIIEDSKMNGVSILAVCDNANSELALKSDAKVIINPTPQRLVKISENDIKDFINYLPGNLINFECDNETLHKIKSLPAKSVHLTDNDLKDALNDLPPEISGLGNIYHPLELALNGADFELYSLAFLDSLIIRLMYCLNLREDDLIDYHDSFNNIDFSSPSKSTPSQKNSNIKSKLVPGVGRIPFPAYSGSDSYIFVSYAHADSNIVYPEIKRFYDNGYNIWYDEGIAPGNEWLSDILEHLKGCDLYMIFVTQNSINSINVKKEFKYAINKGKPILPIYLDDFDEIEMDDEWEYELHNIQGILKTTLDEEEYNYKYTNALSKFGFRILNDTDDVSNMTMIKDKTYNEFKKSDFVDLNPSEYEDKSANKINILAFNEILNNLEDTKAIVNTQSENILKFADIISKAQTHRVSYYPHKIFVLGDYNSRQIADLFALRLKHLGYNVYLIGESNVPPISNQDVLIAISKTGELQSLSNIFKQLNIINVKILTICGNTNSELANRSDVCIIIDSLPQKYYNLKFDEDYDDLIFKLHPKLSELHENDAPLEVILENTAFEICAMAFINSLVIELMYSQNLREKDLEKYYDLLNSGF